MKRKSGRPRKTYSEDRTTITINKAYLDWLNKAAADLGMNRSQFVREAIIAFSDKKYQAFTSGTKFQLDELRAIRGGRRDII
jgi:hypothetical protein